LAVGGVFLLVGGGWPRGGLVGGWRRLAAVGGGLQWPNKNAAELFGGVSGWRFVGG